MTIEPVLIAGQWRPASAAGTFQAHNPATGEALAELFPLSDWSDCDAALVAAQGATAALRLAPRERIARFLRALADRIELRGDEIASRANLETALPLRPRLAEVELPRTTGQLRQAADACVDGSWALPTIDTKLNIRSQLEAIGPVCVFGPNNFPLAFNSVAGGDFAAAIAAGNPVIAKANTSHPGVTKLLAEEALAASEEAELHPATVQLIYRTSHAAGERLVADPRVGATGYTGSRAAGLKLKAAADAAGKPIYLELSSVNPVLILPGALVERRDEIAGEFLTSCLMGTGQFCTNPGLVLLLAGPETEQFISTVVERFAAAPVGALLSSGVATSLAASVATLSAAGAKLLVGGKSVDQAGYRFANTLLRATAKQFIAEPEKLQAEAFGNASLLVVADSADEVALALDRLEGNLTGCIYSDSGGNDDLLYEQLEPHLRPHVGRLLNDKMPTGVAVSPAMNHGGPFPATGHPGFTAVGIPASLRRFARLACYDNVRPHRLPPSLDDAHPIGRMQRLVDGQWTSRDVGK